MKSTGVPTASKIIPMINTGSSGPQTATGNTENTPSTQPEINTYYPTDGGVD